MPGFQVPELFQSASADARFFFWQEQRANNILKNSSTLSVLAVDNTKPNGKKYRLYGYYTNTRIKRTICMLTLYRQTRPCLNSARTMVGSADVSGGQHGVT